MCGAFTGKLLEGALHGGAMEAKGAPARFGRNRNRQLISFL
jgi:hypothetical protein